MTAEVVKPFFLRSKKSRIFCFYRAPANVKGCVLFVPAFAEEMNKSRRQVTVTSDALLSRGYATLTVDLFGTGDSSGEFSEATWQQWKQDVNTAFEWAAENATPVDSIIATRLGCILAAETLREFELRVSRSIFWQPIARGKQLMSQFLRLRVAASMMRADGREDVEGLRQSLREGSVVEVAGYELSPQLWAELERADLLSQLGAELGDLLVLEVGSAREGGVTPASQKILDTASLTDLVIEGLRIEGQPFWSATEIVVNEDLSRRSAECIASRTTSES